MQNYKFNLISSGILILFVLNLGLLTFNPGRCNLMDIEIKSLENENLQNKNVGWVITHGEDDNSTYSITLQDLKAFGANFSLIDSVISSILLNSYNIIVVEEGGTNWIGSELTALYSWVNDGGAIYILGDEPGYSQGNLSQYFNVFYNKSSPSSGLLTSLKANHPLFENVSNLDSALPTASLDETQSIEDLEILARSWDGYPLVASLVIGKGCILWNIDSDGLINDFNINWADHRKFANNSWIWLATPNPYDGNGANGNNLFFILLIITIPAIASIIIVVFYAIKRKKTKSKKFTNESVDEFLRT